MSDRIHTSSSGDARVTFNSASKLLSDLPRLPQVPPLVGQDERERLTERHLQKWQRGLDAGAPLFTHQRSNQPYANGP